MARTNHSVSTESIHTVAPASAASGPNLSDTIPDPHSETSLHSHEADTLASNASPPTSARSGAPSEASQIKFKKVQVSAHITLQSLSRRSKGGISQDDAFEPLRGLLHEMKIFQKKDDTSDDAEKQQLREDFIVKLKRHYNVTHLGRAERPRYTKSPYKIQIGDLVLQEVVISGLAWTDTTMFAFSIRDRTKSELDNGTNLKELVTSLQQQAFKAGLLDAPLATILGKLEVPATSRGDQVETVISHDERAAWLIRMPKQSIGSENPSYVGYGLIEGGELVKETS